MEIQTLAFLSLHTLSDLRRQLFFLSLTGKFITWRCLNFDCQQRKPIFIMVWIWKPAFEFRNKKNYCGQTKENQPINIFLMNMLHFFHTCVNTNDLSSLWKRVDRFEHVHREHLLEWVCWYCTVALQMRLFHRRHYVTRWKAQVRARLDSI